MNGARVRRRRPNGRAPQVEDQDLVAGAVHARDSRARPADGGRPSLQSPFTVRPRCGPARRADLSIARAPSRATASRKSSFSIRRGGGARGGFGRVGRGRRDAAPILERRQRPLAEGDLVDAAPAEMGVHPGDDDRGAVLRLERECALDPEHQGRGLRRRFGVASWRPAAATGARSAGRDGRRSRRRSPASRRSGSLRRGRARPAPPTMSPGVNSASRLAPRRAGFIIARAWGEGLAQVVMSANVSALGGKAKRKAIVARTLRWWDRHRRALAWRAPPDETPDPYRVWLSEVLLQQTTAQAATPYYQAFIATMAAGRGSGRRSARGRDRRVRRPRLLFAGAQPARLRTGNRSPRRAISERGGGPASPCPASAPIPPRRSRRSPSGARPRRSTATSPASSPGCSRSISRSRGREAKSRRRRGRSRQAERAGDFAQALMDIGATICRPRNPDCPSCPLAQDCASVPDREPGSLPAAAPGRRPSRAGRARSSSPAAPTAPFSLAAVRRMGFSPRRSNCRARRGRARAREANWPTSARSSQAGAGCRGRSSRSSPTSR